MAVPGERDPDGGESVRGLAGDVLRVSAVTAGDGAGALVIHSERCLDGAELRRGVHLQRGELRRDLLAGGVGRVGGAVAVDPPADPHAVADLTPSRAYTGASNRFPLRSHGAWSIPAMADMRTGPPRYMVRPVLDAVGLLAEEISLEGFGDGGSDRLGSALDDRFVHPRGRRRSPVGGTASAGNREQFVVDDRDHEYAATIGRVRLVLGPGSTALPADPTTDPRRQRQRRRSGGGNGDRTGRVERPDPSASGDGRSDPSARTQSKRLLDIFLIFGRVGRGEGTGGVAPFGPIAGTVAADSGIPPPPTDRRSGRIPAEIPVSDFFAMSATESVDPSGYG